MTGGNNCVFLSLFFLSMAQRALPIALPPRQYRSPALSNPIADESAGEADQPDQSAVAG
jgi:hypothetical protein